jgi:hypothetical protein
VDNEKTTPGSSDERFNSPSNWHMAHGVTDDGDTVEYTFRGIKTMGRVTIDPKGFGEWPFFGKEDLKMYAEAALLGIKNYPVFYEKRRERMPIMVGFNIPAFTLLDVLAVEAEYFPNDFSNSEHHVWQQSVPIPFTGDARPAAYGKVNKYPFSERDDWKWSVYASKKINDYSEILVQAASDHTWRRNVMTSKAGLLLGLGDEELCQKPSDWYFMIRATFSLK